MEKETYKVMGLELVLPAGRANEIEKKFKPFDIGLKSHIEDYERIINSDISENTCNEAKELRLKLTKIRTGSEKARKDIKGDVLQLSKAIDSVGKLIKDSVSEKEDKLKEIENYFENIEKEKKEKLRIERLEELKKYGIDSVSFALEEMEPIVWTGFLAGQKATYEAEKARKKQELLDRLKADKEKEEREDKLREENERIKADLKAKKEKEQADREKKEAEELARKQAPDKEKLENYFDEIKGKKIPEFSNDYFKEICISYRKEAAILCDKYWNRL